MTATQSYVYQLTNPRTRQFYIGVRTVAHGLVDSDDYMGSGVWPKRMKAEGARLRKEIVEVFGTRQAARALEKWLISRRANEKRCMNRSGVMGGLFSYMSIRLLRVFAGYGNFITGIQDWPVRRRMEKEWLSILQPSGMRSYRK